MKTSLCTFFVAYLVGPCRSVAPLDGIYKYTSWTDTPVVYKMVTKISPELNAHASLTDVCYKAKIFRSGKIPELRAGSLSGYGINKLRLKDDIEIIEPEAFDGLENLTELHVVNNKPTVNENYYFSKDIFDLLVLDVTNNWIVHVAPNAFGALKKLRGVISTKNDSNLLNISHNLLNEGTFYNFHMSIELDLSCNNIHVENIENVITHEISHLLLEHNRLSCKLRLDKYSGIRLVPRLVQEGSSSLDHQGNACIAGDCPNKKKMDDENISAKIRLKAMLVLSILSVIFPNILLACVYKRILIKKYNQFTLLVNDSATNSNLSPKSISFANLRTKFWS